MLLSDAFESREVQHVAPGFVQKPATVPANVQVQDEGQGAKRLLMRFGDVTMSIGLTAPEAAAIGHALLSHSSHGGPTS
jgi:hypothetical protein